MNRYMNEPVLIDLTKGQKYKLPVNIQHHVKLLIIYSGHSNKKNVYLRMSAVVLDFNNWIFLSLLKPIREI